MATREETKRMIEVMQAYINGAIIEYESLKDNWIPATTPSWNWREYGYRIAKQTKKVKLKAWFDGEELRYFDKSFTDANKPYAAWKRVPSEDKEIEVEE